MRLNRIYIALLLFCCTLIKTSDSVIKNKAVIPATLSDNIEIVTPDGKLAQRSFYVPQDKNHLNTLIKNPTKIAALSNFDNHLELKRSYIFARLLDYFNPAHMPSCFIYEQNPQKIVDASGNFIASEDAFEKSPIMQSMPQSSYHIDVNTFSIKKSEYQRYIAYAMHCFASKKQS